MMMKLGMLFGAALLAGCGTAGAQPAGGHDPMTMLDANGDGQVSLDELKQHAAAMFRMVDANGDGQVTMDEFRAHHEAMIASHHPGGPGRGGPPPPPPERLDSNHDGIVTLAELNAAMEEHFARADANRDGFVSREEMEAAHRAMHGRP